MKKKEEEKKRQEEEEKKLKQLKIQLCKRQKNSRLKRNETEIINESKEQIKIENKNKNKTIKIKIDDKKRNNEEKINIKEKEKNMEINQVLEDMCIYGNIIKKEIKKEKKNNPSKFIETKEALKKEKEDLGLFALGLLSKSLEDSGVETAIETSINDDQENEKENDERTTCLQFLTNGMMNKTKYDLHFDFGKEKNEELLNDEEKFDEFIS